MGKFMNKYIEIPKSTLTFSPSRHTHGFNNDLGTWGTHFFENGGGGGIQSESSTLPSSNLKDYVSNIWVGHNAPYGFFELSFSKNWTKVQFVTFDDQWQYSLDKNSVKAGGLKRGHCRLVGRTGKKGRAC